MRPELEQLARIDSYVNNTMNAADTAAFEAEMVTDASIKEAVETQSLLVTAVNRKALMAHVIAATPPTMSPPRDGSSILSKFKWPIILSSVVVGAVISFFAFKGENPELRESHENLHSNIANKQNNLADNEGHRGSRDADSNAPNDADFTFIPANTNVIPTTRREFGGLETWVAPELQQIIIDPTQDELIECKDGTVIFIPEDAFVDANGNVVEEAVTLEIIEALTMDKIVAYNLATMNGSNALKSGGMVYVQPKLNGTELDLAEGKSLHIEVPTDEYDSNMQAWQGVPDGNGNLNWENPQEIENYLIPVAMSSLDFLPNGFREEVAATLPFRNHKKSSKQLEDSLYFAMSNINESGEVTNPTITESNSNSTSRLKDDIINPTTQNSQPKTVNKGPRMLPNIFRIGKRSKIQRGLGAVKFQNLPAKDEFRATFFIKDESYSTPIDTNTLQTDLIGTVRIRIETAGCEPFTVKNVQISSDQITFIDCSPWACFSLEDSTSTLISADEVCETCYINPSDIYAIHQPEFEETFLATKEFQERLQVLHTMENAQPLFDLYVDQLDKNLYEIDSQIAARLTGKHKATFEAFAAEKLTTVKPNGQEYDKLRKFYTTKSKEQQQKVRKAQQAYERKSMAELEAVAIEMQELRANFYQNQEFVRSKYQPAPSAGSPGVSPPRNASFGNTNSFQPSTQVQNSNPQVGQQAAYKVNWYGTGWMNIDAFLHELSKGKKQIPINVADSKGMKVYQSVNSLNTLLTLNKTVDGYNAYFPTSNNATFSNSLALGVSRADGKLKVAAQFFNPYASTAVTLNNWETISESEFKRRLKELYPGGRKMLKAIKQKEKEIQEAQERKRRAEQQRKKMENELKALDQEFQQNNAQLEAKTEAIRMRQAAERLYVQHLEDFVNPCHPDYGISNQSGGNKTSPSDEIVAVPDEEAYFPGGTAEFMRWISDNLQYPKEAQDAGVQGKVYLEFVVEKDGSASNVKIVNSNPETKLLESEAIRLVQGMPPWKSAQVNGSSVRTRCTLPLTFTLN